MGIAVLTHSTWLRGAYARAIAMIYTDKKKYMVMLAFCNNTRAGVREVARLLLGNDHVPK